MINTNITFDEVAFEKIFTTNDLVFLKEIGDKKEKISKEINGIEIKRSEIIKQISENKKAIEKNPKQSREYISNSESTLECIEIIYNNLNKLLNEYNNIEKNVIIIAQKFRLYPENQIIKENVEVLSNQIAETKKLEDEIKNDNEKNYIIIDSFLDKKIKDDFTNNEDIEASQSNSDKLEDNLVLKVYEKRVELPYTKKEVEEFMKEYPNAYKTPQDVINKEFVIHISMFNKHPILSRFKEAYYLCRTKEMMTVFDSFNYAKSIMFKSNLNAYIIAASKSKRQLEDYIDCLDKNTLDKFKYFKIIFAVNPLSVN